MKMKSTQVRMLSGNRQLCRLICVTTSLILAASGLTNCQSDASEHQPQQQQQQQQQQHTLTRKSIVFDLKTPKVFYCPQEKPSDMEKMIVKAQSLDKLCEFEGKRKPKDAQSDCYNDVDETEFACDEKKRFMIRLDLASDGFDLGAAERIDGLDYILSKGAGGATSINKKKANSSKEKKNHSSH